MNLKAAREFWGILTLLLILLGFGCSSNGGIEPVLPENPVARCESASSHSLWGLFQFACNPEAGTIDVIPLRAAAAHLNVLPFLEPPPFLFLSLESLEINGNIIDAGIGLRHPFLGLTEFTGFDVSGILISSGSYSGYGDTGINIAGPGDLYLVNADGHARWWNPDEFPYNPSSPISSYIDGLLGTPDSIGNYDATVNGYKYFADGLGPDDPATSIDHSRRGMFGAGQKNIRHYTIDMGDTGLVFNYAVDACWVFPNGSYPWTAPDDFPPEANRVEPYIIDVVETLNTLWYSGGSWGGALSMDINVYDWYNIEQDSLWVECPGAFAAVEMTAPTGGTGEYSTFHVDLNEITLESDDELMILITADCEDTGFQDFIPGVPTAAYKVHYAEVATEPGVEPPIAVADSIPEIGFINYAGDFYGDDSQGEIDLYEWDFEGDGIYDWSSTTTGNTTHAYDTEDYYNATLKVSNAGGFDTDSLEIRMIDPLPIISNGNFWYETWDDWNFVEGGTYGYSEHSLEDNHMFKHYVSHYRTVGPNDGGQVRAMQTLDIDVTAYDHLYFNIFFQLITQECPGDGWWAVNGGWGDFPLHIWIFYLNQNDQPRYVHCGYILDSATTQYNWVWEWDTPDFDFHHPDSAYYKYEAYVPKGEWQERKTIDLMTELPVSADAPKHLTQIWIWSTGWDFEMFWILPWFSDH